MTLAEDLLANGRVPVGARADPITVCIRIMTLGKLFTNAVRGLFIASAASPAYQEGGRVTPRARVLAGTRNNSLPRRHCADP